MVAEVVAHRRIALFALCFMCVAISRLRFVLSSSSSSLAAATVPALRRFNRVGFLCGVSSSLHAISLSSNSTSARNTSAPLATTTNRSMDTGDIDDAWKATTLSAEELIEIVDENNKVVHPPATRREMRAKKLPHRATYAFIRDSNNYFYVQKRSMIKDYCPGYFDPTPGGVVAAGESYTATNLRECEEEMGISSTPMEHLFTFYYEDNRIKCWGDAFDCIYDGPLRLQKEEVDSVHMMSMKEIFDRFERGENFTPDSIHACREYVKMRGMPEPSRPNVKPTLFSSDQKFW